MSELRKTYEGGLFFVTLTVAGWVDVFTRPVYVEELVKNLKHCQQNEGLELYAYVMMSSHLHLIAARAQGDLTELLGRFKSVTAKKLLRLIAQHEQESRREWLLSVPVRVFCQAAQAAGDVPVLAKDQPPHGAVESSGGAAKGGVHPHESGGGGVG